MRLVLGVSHLLVIWATAIFATELLRMPTMIGDRGAEHLIFDIGGYIRQRPRFPARSFEKVAR
ncbi:hypothetical protein EGJ86_19405 [Pseudomonas sp. o96-267]|nr:hypothetical protein EGJ86_19405 [Pseudomonas sp. o96-267]